MKKYTQINRLLFLRMFSLIVFGALTTTCSSIASPKLDDVVYTLDAASIRLTNERMQADIQQLMTPSDVEKFLKIKLSKAKKNNDSYYIGYALAAFDALEKSLKINTKVKIAIADLLAFNHDFKGAIEALDLSIADVNFQKKATMRRLNIQMLTTNIEQANIECNRLKQFNELEIYAFCSLWVEGMQGEPADSIQKMERLLGVIQSSQGVTKRFNWLLNMKLDLQLKNKAAEDAIKTLKRIYAIDSSELGPAKQVLDYLLVNDLTARAKRVIQILDLAEQLPIRYILSSSKTDKRALLLPKAEEKLFVIEQTEDSSEYFILALWHIQNHGAQDVGRKNAESLARLAYAIYKDDTHLALVRKSQIKPNTNTSSLEMKNTNSSHKLNHSQLTLTESNYAS